jgi:hypothetical protein
MYSYRFALLAGVFALASPGITASSDDAITTVPTPTVSIPISTSVKWSSLNSTVPDLSMPTDECNHEEKGYGPQPFPDTPLAFLQIPEISAAALKANIPEGYSKVYEDEHASSSTGWYLRYSTMKKYSTNECAARCDETDNCRAFNIFFERAPAFNLGEQCRNLSSTTLIKCALWGDHLDKARATNTGYERVGFWVVIAGSNAYNKVDGMGKDFRSFASIGTKTTVGLELLGVTLAILMLPCNPSAAHLS